MPCKRSSQRGTDVGVVATRHRSVGSARDIAVSREASREGVEVRFGELGGACYSRS